jgi:hypothetical protein
MHLKITPLQEKFYMLPKFYTLPIFNLNNPILASVLTSGAVY